MADPRAPKIAYEALTYDDVLLLPAYSEVLPRDCDTGTRLTPTIRLHLPLKKAGWASSIRTCPSRRRLSRCAASSAASRP
jgi:hypothetical protein